ncbi:hypothetical protein K504DRAFT_535132 [Pleomassaria siparia CBS 279.74]|uniref:Uncharacterized protein n=1 Tax=Pleomassaria siparia CBS 279.74 TaxID=1314801 RepID=A0A6G1K3Z1_9PLEO|nr:hypothetical protein K504DRAFT_535132 [Pleomassaria siparia CBS 279.74]
MPSTKRLQSEIATTKPSKMAKMEATASKTRHRVAFLKNGLINISKTSEHVAAIAKRNATESPLLRLPGEIRNRIWEYACCGEVVFSYSFDGGKGKSNRRIEKTSLENTAAQSAFRIPRICRQIYVETATLPYSLSTFMWRCPMLEYRRCECLKDTHSWKEMLIPAHRDVVGSIELYCPESWYERIRPKWITNPQEYILDTMSRRVLI